MGQMRMFRDRMVSMEQTLEGGEKHLELLKALCLEALPDFRYRDHALDHERDLFVMTLEAADGRRKEVGWTRMTLFDAERIPSVIADPAAAVRGRIVEFLRTRAGQSQIVVTFRHLEDGWTDTREAKPGRRRRRRGRGAGGGGERAGAKPAARPGERTGGRPAPARGAEPASPRPAGRPAAARPQSPRPGAPPAGRPAEAPGGGGERPAGSRRRFRRRRRGRGGGGGGGPKPPQAPGA